MAKKKHGNGRGCIGRLPNGTYRVRYTEGRGADGRQIQRSRTFATAREAQALLTKALHELNTGTHVTPTRLTVAKYLDDWLKTVRAAVTVGTVAPATLRSYEQTVRDHLVPDLGRIELPRLTPSHVETLLQKKAGSVRMDGTPALSSRSVQYIRAVLRIALNRAVIFGYVGRNVACLVTVAPPKRREIRCPTSSDCRAFLTAVRGDRLEALYAITALLGLRKGEVLGLTWDCVDFERRRIYIKKQLQFLHGSPTLRRLKTDKSTRALPLTSDLSRLLHEHKARQLEARLARYDVWGGEYPVSVDWGLVFTTSIGSPINPRNLSRDFYAHLRAAGLPHMGFHSLRHGAASLALEQGVPLKVVSELLGHSQIAITADTYSHVAASLLDDAVARIGEAISGT